jgi:beta-N-acetylhexosaminidase
MRILKPIEYKRPWARLSIAFTLVLVPYIFFAQARLIQDADRPVEGTTESHEWAKQTLKELSLEEKVGQMLQVRYFADYSNFDAYEYKYLRAELQKYHIGSVVFGMHFNGSGPIRSSPLDAARVANQLQRDSKVPLLLAADLERGVASRLSDVPAFPWPMAFGAANDWNDVERFAAITGREARAIGVQWALAPVADLNSNPSNPIINTRSFGEDPEHVGALVAAFIRGAHANGLLVTAKHFPGNGNTSVDSHRALVSLDADWDHLAKVEFPPFKTAIDAGVDSILLAHARVPALEPDPDKITTISAKVVTGTLKGQLGFKGVVLTDALEMQGLTRLYDPNRGSPTALAAVDAVKAGCDVIMVPTDLDGAFHAIIESVRNGEILESRINESVRKVLEMKAAVGLNKSRLVDLDQVQALTSQPKDIDFAQHIADSAITLVRDTGRMLPLQRTEPVSGKHGLVAILDAMGLESGNGHEFEKALKARRPDAMVFFFDGRFSGGLTPEILKAANEADQVIAVAYAVHGGTRQRKADGARLSSFGLLGPSRQLLQQVLTTAPDKTIVIALGSPYLIEDFPGIKTYICTYAMASTSELSAVKALFGEIQNHAKLPVTLPGVAPRGFSIRWPSAEFHNGALRESGQRQR